MENEFDFFNNLNFGTDFTKQGLGGYGTYTDQYTTPVDRGNSNPVLIESPTGIETIPAPITPFINQGNDGNAGIPTLKTSTYNETLEDELTDEDKKSLEIAKKDTNVNNLINMGLVDKAKDYVKNNYGYMIMNFIFPGSGYAAKAFVDSKKEKEAIATAALAKAEEERKAKETIALAELEQAIITGQSTESMARPDTGPLAVGAGMGIDGNYVTDYFPEPPTPPVKQSTFEQSYDQREDRGNNNRQSSPATTSQGVTSSQHAAFKMAKGGRIGYGTGGIVTL
jgi:hypothetical protein